MKNSLSKDRLYHTIFGTDTVAGKRFDLLLIYAILLSVLVLFLDSVTYLSEHYGLWLNSFEWAFTILFTVEYVLRLYCSPNPWRYARSFYGIIDLLAIVPSYLSLFYGDANYLLVVRLLRVLRIFRVLKLFRYISEANMLMRAIIASRRKIFVFFMVVLVIATVFGALMYVVEGPNSQFTSIPKSIYWCIVTITTVGYGDITPTTVLGQIISTLAMLTGYSIIAVPTGIFTAEIAHEMQNQRDLRHCTHCEKIGHDVDAQFCKKCGAELPEISKT